MAILTSGHYSLSSTSGNYERCAFSWEGCFFFCHEVFFSMYLPLALEVYNRLFMGSLGLMAVAKIKKHLLGLTQMYSP